MGKPFGGFLFLLFVVEYNKLLGRSPPLTTPSAAVSCQLSMLRANGVIRVFEAFWCCAWVAAEAQAVIPTSDGVND
jgi:hypothetical protein